MPAPAVTRRPFGTTLDGAPVEEFCLANLQGLTVRLTNFGARIISILAPDRHGRLDDIVLGYGTLSGYLDDSHYFGAVVGRVVQSHCERPLLPGRRHRTAQRQRRSASSARWPAGIRPAGLAGRFWNCL